MPDMHGDRGGFDLGGPRGLPASWFEEPKKPTKKRKKASQDQKPNSAAQILAGANANETVFVDRKFYENLLKQNMIVVPDAKPEIPTQTPPVPEANETVIVDRKVYEDLVEKSKSLASRNTMLRSELERNDLTVRYACLTAYSDGRKKEREEREGREEADKEKAEKEKVAAAKKLEAAPVHNANQTVFIDRQYYESLVEQAGQKRIAVTEPTSANNAANQTVFVDREFYEGMGKENKILAEQNAKLKEEAKRSAELIETLQFDLVVARDQFADHYADNGIEARFKDDEYDTMPSSPPIPLSPETRMIQDEERGAVDIATWPAQDEGPPQVPTWLEHAMQTLRKAHLDCRIEAFMRCCHVDNATGSNLPTNELQSGQEASGETRFQFVPYIRCLDCPGKLYSVRRETVMQDFEVHLRNRKHREMIQQNATQVIGGGE